VPARWIDADFARRPAEFERGLIHARSRKGRPKAGQDGRRQVHPASEAQRGAITRCDNGENMRDIGCSYNDSRNTSRLAQAPMSLLVTDIPRLFLQQSDTLH
jgi:hypothetical protein